MKTQKFDNGNELTLIEVIDNKQDYKYTHRLEIRFDGDDNADVVAININNSNNIAKWLEDNCDIDGTIENVELFNNLLK